MRRLHSSIFPEEGHECPDGSRVELGATPGSLRLRQRRPVPIATWRFAPPKPEPVHLNLWLHNGLPLTDGKAVEIVIRSFTYKP
jgi:hypothetical protein